MLSFLDRAIEKIDNCVLETNSRTVLDSVASTRRNGWKQVGILERHLHCFLRVRLLVEVSHIFCVVDVFEILIPHRL
jgi:hypothetical protein